MSVALDLPNKDVISVDGKTSKGSRNKSKDQKALHMVSALCHSHGLVIGQTKTDEKSNEITAIPELLDQLFIEGCIVTIDAMGAQKKIVEKIVKDKKADYVINLKGNQETLQAEVKEYFEELGQSGELENIKEKTQQKNEEEPKDGGKIEVYSTLEKGHGRIEKRTYFYSTDLDWMVDAKRDWEKLTGIGMVIREVEYTTEPDKRTNETAYYIGSVNNVIDFAMAARHHWGVESMHWSLDVTFGDDRNQTREGVAAQNLAMVKRLVFNTLKNENKVRPKMSKPKKRVLASVDPEYRDVLINLNFKER
jgi:predicted transposase YbfD/YdcC